MTPILSLPTQTSHISINSLLSPLHIKVMRIWESLKGIIGVSFRSIIFPLSVPSILQKYKNIFLEEKKFFHSFWDPNIPPHPRLLHQREILDYFSWKTEKLSFEVEGKSFEVEYSLIEPKDLEGKTPKNFVYAPGNLAFHDSYILGLYPFLASYLEKRKRHSDLVPLRFFILSQYDTYREDGQKYFPKDLHEPGLVFAQILKSIAKQKGPIDFIAAHSLGSIVLASSLRHFSPSDPSKEKDMLPKKLYLDRGVSSMKEACAFIGPLLKPLGFFVAKLSGWDLDMGYECYKHLPFQEGQTIFFSEVKKDCFFPNEKSLVQSPHIQALEKEKRAVTFSFDFPAQQYHPRSHHMLNNGYLEHYNLLKKEGSPLQEGENMADLILRSLYEEENKS